MEPLIIEPTKSSPRVLFDPVSNFLEIVGESYPEHAAAFYEPVFAWLDRFLQRPETPPVEVNLELSYFNSSSSKILLNFFDLLEEASKAGQRIVVNWKYQEGNETALECGQEFLEDLHHLVFNLVEIPE